MSVRGLTNQRRSLAYLALRVGLIAMLTLPLPPFPQVPVVAAVASSAQIYRLSFDDLRRFLASDGTDQLTWSPRFNCVQFAEQLVGRARGAGFIAVTAIAVWEGDWGAGYDSHEFAAIYTADRGFVWIEPQDDQSYDQSMPDHRLCELAEPCSVKIRYVAYTFEGHITTAWSPTYVPWRSASAP